jgi:hypothetical protein
MDRKLILMGVLIAALTAYIVVSKKGGSGTALELEDWKGPVDRITIVSPDKNIDITRVDSRWVVGEKKYPADEKAVSDIEKLMKEMIVTDLISEQSFYTSYDLDADKKTDVTLYQEGKAVRKISFGKQGSTRQHTYIRVAEEKPVYLAAGIYDQITSKTVESLRNKEIIKLDKSLVQALDIKYKGRLTSIIKKVETSPAQTDDKTDGKTQKPDEQKAGTPEAKTEKWVLSAAEGTGLSTAKIDPVISALSPLTASAFAADDMIPGKNPICEVTAAYGDKKFTLKIFEKEKDSNRYPAVTPDYPFMFYIEEWKAKKLFIEKPDDLKDGK